jgi:dephospho-CoA kinase
LPGGEALAEIAREWPEVLDARGQLDRRKLGAVVFSDRGALARLEAIMHPRIVALSKRRAAELARAGHRLAFYEASLLVETGRARELDGLVVVDAPVDTRIARVVARDGVTAAQVRARMAAQQPIDEKRRVATRVIENASTIEALTAQVEAMLEAMRAEQSVSGPA